MGRCLFVSDLHGRVDRYQKLVLAVRRIRPAAVFLGGDLLPFPLSVRSGEQGPIRDFLRDFVIPGFTELQAALGADYPRVFLVLGNDDPAVEEDAVREAEAAGLWEYAHGKRLAFGDFDVYGYACVPPTPFGLKDWERYDVSRYVPPGCISPEEGVRSVPVPGNVVRHSTIQDDLAALSVDAAMERAIFLFHTPPHETVLDRAALDGKRIDHVPLDVHIGSIAVRRFIEARQPLITLHGHVHESVRITGAWRQRIGRTHLFGAAHDGPDLALVQFDPADPGAATRELL